MTTPEQKTRENIKRQLKQAGWIVRNYKAANPSVGLGIAVREYPTESGSADYILFIDRKPVGITRLKEETKFQIDQQIQNVKIEKRFSEADNLEKAIDEGLEKSETLKQSILKQAFEGRLV